jgi:hypothetical protein
MKKSGLNVSEKHWPSDAGKNAAVSHPMQMISRHISVTKTYYLLLVILRLLRKFIGNTLFAFPVGIIGFSILEIHVMLDKEKYKSSFFENLRFC